MRSGGATGSRMSRSWSSIVLMLHGCIGHGFIVDDFVDTFFVDGDPPDPGFRCVDGAVPDYPADGAIGVHPGVAPSALVLDGVEGVGVSLRRGLSVIETTTLVSRGSGYRLFELRPAVDVLIPGDYHLIVDMDDRWMPTDGGTVELCSNGASFAFSVAARPEWGGAPFSGSWWLPGADATGAHAEVLQRILPRMGSGYGLALAFSATPGEGDAVRLALSTVSRTPGLPDNADDPPDTLDAVWADGWLTARADHVELGDPVTPVGVDNLVVALGRELDHGGLVGVRVAGRLDLSRWPADRREAACAQADERSLGCAPCADGTPACITLDARGMSGVPR